MSPADRMTVFYGFGGDPNSWAVSNLLVILRKQNQLGSFAEALAKDPTQNGGLEANQLMIALAEGSWKYDSAEFIKTYFQRSDPASWNQEAAGMMPRWLAFASLQNGSKADIASLARSLAEHLDVKQLRGHSPEQRAKALDGWVDEWKKSKPKTGT
jgi:hypothetical protein